jgi:hypothetical protein
LWVRAALIEAIWQVKAVIDDTLVPIAQGDIRATNKFTNIAEEFHQNYSKLYAIDTQKYSKISTNVTVKLQ